MGNNRKNSLFQGPRHMDSIPNISDSKDAPSKQNTKRSFPESIQKFNKNIR